MSLLSNHNKSEDKDKKKSLLERFVSHASHTLRISKKSSRKKKQKSTLVKPILNIKDGSRKLSKFDKGGIQTCTFCDYCDGEIVADFTGQNIIYHDSCKEKHMLVSPVEIGMELKPLSIKNSQQSEKCLLCSETNLDTPDNMDSRLSIRLNNISINDMSQQHDDLTFTMMNNTAPCIDVDDYDDYLSDKVTGSYTFSTVDLPTIKHLGISIKKVPSSPIKLANNTVVSNEQMNLVRKQSTISCDSTTNYISMLPDELRQMMEIFNKNEQGLMVEPKSGQIMGKFRVFINLLRPVKMLLTARPPSHFDIFADNNNPADQGTISRAYYNQEAIFWLPRGTTKVLYININCPTMDVISLLLSKFNIKNNPKKFALYEHSIKSQKEVEVRKLRQLQCPLKIMLDWCTKDVEYYHQNLETKRFVLQENDPGSIEWDEFSNPELKTFLMILKGEEEEQRRNITRKYDILRSEIYRRMAIKKNIKPHTVNVDL